MGKHPTGSMSSNWTDLLRHPVEVPGRTGLRRFAFALATVIAVLFGGLLPWLLDSGTAFWPFGLALVFVVWGLLGPASLGKPYIAWVRLGLILNRITAPLILFVLFFGMITPVGLVRRLFGDPLGKRFERGAATYRKPLNEAPPHSLENPF